MGDRKTSSIVVLFSCFLLLGSAPSIVFASSDNWVEVTTFTGSAGGVHSTSHFTVDYVDWRIRWEVTPGNDYERGTSFNAYVYPSSGGPQIEEMHHTIGTEKTTGIKNIYNHRGIFYIVVVTTNIADVKLTIEQNIESIPEFPSWIIMPLVLVGSLTIVLFKNKVWRRFS